ncbi:MAG TPA: DUF1501 domain-containing protein, partial [Planctomycetaceae bacterium]|nr:DUF1501 domain-containing protein [Planctomycetaceae bacterium]
MLDFSFGETRRNCEGTSRRDFMRVGGLGLTGLTLAGALRNQAMASSARSEKSVIWLWLSGGPTHVETFDPKMTAPAEYRSMTGEVKTNIP